MQAVGLVGGRYAFQDAVLLGQFPLVGDRFDCPVATLFTLLACLEGSWRKLQGWRELRAVDALAERLDIAALSSTQLLALGVLRAGAAQLREPVILELRKPRLSKAGGTHTLGKGSVMLCRGKHGVYGHENTDSQPARALVKPLQRELVAAMVGVEKSLLDPRSFGPYGCKLDDWACDATMEHWAMFRAGWIESLKRLGCPFEVRET